MTIDPPSGPPDRDEPSGPRQSPPDPDPLPDPVVGVPRGARITVLPENAEFYVDQVADPEGTSAQVLHLDQGFTVRGHIDFPNWLTGTGNVSVYADQRGGGYDEKILSKDITITGSPTDPGGVARYDWTVTYPTDLPSGSTPLSDPSPAPGSMVYSLTAVFTFEGVLQDIGAFVDMGSYSIH